MAEGGGPNAPSAKRTREERVFSRNGLGSDRALDNVRVDLRLAIGEVAAGRHQVEAPFDRWTVDHDVARLEQTRDGGGHIGALSAIAPACNLQELAKRGVSRANSAVSAKEAGALAKTRPRMAASLNWTTRARATRQARSSSGVGKRRECRRR